MSEDGTAPLDRLDAIAASLAQVAASLDEQREDLRLALEVLVEVASRLDHLEGDQPDLAPAPGHQLRRAAASLRSSVRGLRRERP